MEREGEGRRGGEMRKGRRGIVIGGMVLGLLMGCNNGGELEAQKRLSDIGRSAENAFYEFMGLIADTLGFTVKADTNKSAVGDYFKGLASGVDKTIQALVEIGNKIQQPSGNDKRSISSETSNQEIESAKNILKELKKHLEDLKDIGDASQKVGEAVAYSGAKEGTAAADVELKKVLTAFKGIVEEAGKVGVVKPVEGNAALNNATGVNNTNGAKILSTATGTNPTTGDESKAAALLATVSGKEILAAIVNSKEEDPQINGSSGADVTTTALSFAKGNSAGSTMAQNTAKASALAGGIALRSLVKGGKLARVAADGSSGEGKEVQGIGITAVNKLLVAVEDIIKKTVNKTLVKVKDAIDKSRSSKEAVK